MTQADRDRIESALTSANAGTSGVVAVRIVPDDDLDAYAKAVVEFESAGLHTHGARNAALVLVAPRAQRYAVIGDTALHERVGEGFWNEVVQEMRPHFGRDAVADAIVHAVNRIGAALHAHFPSGDAQ